MLSGFLHLALFLVGALGVLLVIAGPVATLKGISLALPGLGLIIGGPVILVLGLLLVVVTVVGFKLLPPL